MSTATYSWALTSASNGAEAACVLGPWTYIACVVGSGAVAATVVIEGRNGSNDSWTNIGAFALSGTRSDCGSVPVYRSASYTSHRVRCTAISGTGAVVTVNGLAGVGDHDPELNQTDVLTVKALVAGGGLTAAEVPALKAVVSGAANPTFSFYVDPTSGIGSDDNDGKSADTPFATLAAAVAAVGATPSLSIGIRAGKTFREQITSAAVGLTVDKYGTGDTPLILGSTALTGAWTNVSGNIYSTPLAYTPATAAWVSAAGVWVKLYPGTAGALTANQFAVTGGNLQVNIGKDPTGDTIEVPRNISNTLSTAVGLNTTGASQTFKNLRVYCWPNAGANTVSADTKYTAVDCSFSAYDGFNQFSGATNFLIDQCVASYNGMTVGSAAGPGDGSSAHHGATDTIRRSRFIGNTQTGVGNLQNTAVLVERNYFEDNHRDMQMYSTAGGSAALLTTFRYNIAVKTKAGLDAFFSVTDNASPTGVVRWHNNTCIKLAAAGTSAAAGFLNGMVVDLANNLFDMGAAHSNVTGVYQGTVTSRNNTARGVTIFFQSGYGPASTTADTIVTSEPLLVSASTGIYGLKAASPALNTGVSLGYSEDYRGNLVPATPDRGALERL